MIKYFTYEKGPKSKDGKPGNAKVCEVETYRLVFDSSTREKYAKAPERQTGDFHYHNGIDKMAFLFKQEYLNPYSPAIEHNKSGLFTLNRHGDYFTVNIHKEYIPTDENLEAFVESVFRYLVFSQDLFFLPIRKTEYNHETGEITETDFQCGSVDSDEEFFQKIYESRKLKCIELCFDMNIRVRRYLKPEDFHDYKGTLYSKDYRVYDSGNVKESFPFLDFNARNYARTSQYRYHSGLKKQSLVMTSFMIANIFLRDLSFPRIWRMRPLPSSEEADRKSRWNKKARAGNCPR